MPRQFSPLNTSIWDSTFIHDGLSVGVLGVSCRATVEHRMTEEEPFRVTNEKSTLMILKTRLRDLYSVKGFR